MVRRDALANLVARSKDRIQTSYARFETHLKSRNILQFYCVVIVASIPLLWTLNSVTLMVEFGRQIDGLYSAAIIVWAIGFLPLGIMMYLLWRMSYFNLDRNRVKTFISGWPYTLRAVTAVALSSWVLGNIMLYLNPELRHLDTMKLTLSFTELDLLWPFGALGAILLVMRKSETENLIEGLRNATPEQRQQIGQLLNEAES